MKRTSEANRPAENVNHEQTPRPISRRMFLKAPAALGASLVALDGLGLTALAGESVVERAVLNPSLEPDSSLIKPVLRISQIEPVNHVVMLRLEGRVVGAWVPELRKSCEQALAEGRPLKLHLAAVEFADANGVALLSSLRSRGVGFVECQPFVEAQLKAPAT